MKKPAYLCNDWQMEQRKLKMERTYLGGKSSWVVFISKIDKGVPGIEGDIKFVILYIQSVIRLREGLVCTKACFCPVSCT
jgi:hypothetical protein